MRALIISDTHMQAGGRTDSFYSDEPLCELIYYHRYSPIFLMGDIIEGNHIKCESDVRIGHPDVYYMLKKYATVYLRGNHDSDINNFFGLDVIDSLVIDDTLYIHGHQLDYRNSGPTSWIGKGATVVAKSLQFIIGKKYKAKFRGLFDNRGRYSHNNYYFSEIKSTMKDHGFNRVVMGHSHTIDRIEEYGLEYINTGHWIHGRVGDYQIVEV